MPSSVSGFKQIDSAEHAAYQKEIQDKGTAAGVNERIAYYGAGTTTAFYAGAGDRFTTQTALQVLQATARDWSSDPKTVSAIGIGQTRMTADGDAQFACAPVTGSYPGGYCVWVDSQTFGWVRAYAANDPLSIAKLLRTEVIAG